MAQLRADEIRLTLELPECKLSVVTQTDGSDRLEAMQHICVLLDDWATERLKAYEEKQRDMYAES
jgi:hypothetical protein